ncbi:MAG: DUF4326 domain-containing protein [Pseudomonadota bacterium]
MTAPRRIQLSRAKGWRMPPNTVKVDRSTRWGNPWTVARAREVGFAGTDAELAARCVGFFRNGINKGLPAVCSAAGVRENLRGKNLACWCALDAPCHADVLMEIANGPVCEAVP